MGLYSTFGGVCVCWEQEFVDKNQQKSGGLFMGEQMTVQMNFFAEQAAKELVDEHVMRELELNNEMVAQL